ncbi:MAG: hypothetical protein JSU90_05520 [Nitrospiraceae bacterium]|nr:MAG: hypothetical protein JSU90_05520 [Nitrospiraceae bacterium]
MSRTGVSFFLTATLIALCVVSARGQGRQGLFQTAEEFTAHARGQEGCVSVECHAGFLGDRAFSHEPVMTGSCEGCHEAQAYPDSFGISSDQRALCAGCHKALEGKLQDSQFIHGPILNSDCSSCHDPHGSDRPFFLRQDYGSLCTSCHAAARLFPGEFVHQPVNDGNCGLCHDPHASNIKARLTDAGANLCISCHEDMVSGMVMEYVHAPLIETGCTGCHDPHSGRDRNRLKMPREALCFSCHELKEQEIGQYSKKHVPAEKGECTACHSPHFSEFRALLKGKTDEVCYGCHEESREWEKRRFQHGPVVQGDCTVCHNPHGSDNTFILRLAFPHKFYTSYEKGKYSLCLLCHKEAMIIEEKTETATNFRNGDINLHRLHVHQEKGRSCRACHDVHASDHEGRIRDEFPFGTANIPMIFSKTENGGRCIPGCHRERGYDRVNKVDNNR